MSTDHTTDDGAEMRDGIEKALERIRPTLQSDGFDLTLQDVDPDGSANITLEAKDDACGDCLVPDEVLVGILEKEIKSEEPAVKKVLLHKPDLPEA